MNQKFLKFIAAIAAFPIAAAPCTFPAASAEAATVMTASTQLASASAVLIDISAADFTDIRVSDYRSNWNLLVQTGLWYCTPTSCEMDLQALYDTVIANSGSCVPFFTALFASVSEETLTYAENVFTITAGISRLGDALADENGVTLEQQIEAIAAQYGLTLASSGILDTPCEVEIRSDFSSVGTTGAVRLSYAVKTDDGTFTLLGENSLSDYLGSKLDAYAASLPAEQAEFAAVVDAYRSRLHSFAELGAESILQKEVTVSSASLGDALTQIEARYPEYAERIPASAETAAQLLESSWNSLMAQLNTNVVPDGGALSLDVHEIAAIFDSLTNVTLTVQNGTAYISGTMEDAQSDAVKAYYAENTAALAALAESAQAAGDAEFTGLAAYKAGMTLEDTAKFVEVSLPLNMLETGSGDLYYNIYRTYRFSAPAVTETTPAETTETSEETTTEMTETSEETTVTETSTSAETEVTKPTEPNKPEKPEKPEDDCCCKHDKQHCHKHEHHEHPEHEHEHHCPKHPDHKLPEHEHEHPDCDKHEHPHCGEDREDCKKHEDCKLPEKEHPTPPENIKLPEKEQTVLPHHQNAGKREHFHLLQKQFEGFHGMRFDGGVPCMTLKR